MDNTKSVPQITQIYQMNAEDKWNDGSERTGNPKDRIASR